MDDAEAARLLSPVPEEQRQNSWWIILRDGTPVPGDEGGGIALLSQMKGTRGLARLLAWLRLSRAIDLMDKLVARQRGRLGRIVPDVPVLHQYP